MIKRAYTKYGRLSDVLALIQVLALDKDAYRSEDGMTDELKGPPRSASNWYVLAAEHPEFFRVNPVSDHGLSLAARHVLPRLENQHRPQLSPEFTATLLRTAIDLNDREVKATEWWHWLIPFGSALIGSLTTLLTLWLQYWYFK